MSSKDWPKLEEIVQPVLGGSNAFLVGLSERRERGRRVLQIFVDTDEGITIEHCAEISRALGASFDAENAISEPYELEVSSPGIDRPLKMLRQYRKNVGRKYKVQYWQETERRMIQGTLAAVDGEKLTFTTEKQETVLLDFSKIIESVEELPW